MLVSRLVEAKVPKIGMGRNDTNLNLMELFLQGRYKQIAEIIMMREAGRGTINKNQYVFSNLGLVRDLLDHEFSALRANIVNIYRALHSYGPDRLQAKAAAALEIKREITKIKGIETIYEALLLRQTLKAKQNQFQCNLAGMREQDKEDIEIIKDAINGQVCSNKIIMLFWKFAVEGDLVSLCTSCYDDLRRKYDARVGKDIYQFYDMMAEGPSARELFARTRGSFNVSQLLLILDNLKFTDYRSPLFILLYFVLDLQQELVKQQLTQNLSLSQ